MAVDFFEEKQEEESFRKFIGKPDSSGLNGWLIKKGLAKSEKNAEKMLIIVAVIFFALTFLFLIFNRNQSSGTAKIKTTDYTNQTNYPPRLKIYEN